MGSASSVAARAPPTAVVDALRHLDAALIGLAQVVVTDQAARAFFTGAADHEILSQLKHVDNRDVAALRADLAKAVLGQLKGAGSTSHGDREAELPAGPLSDFVPLCAEESVVSQIKPDELSEAQLSLQTDADDEGALTTLRAAVGAIGPALRAVVEKRIHTEGIVHVAKAVVEAGKDDFLGVYEAVWSRVKADKGSERLQGAVAALALPAAEPEQEATDAVQLLQHAARAKPKYDALLRELLPDVQLDLPKVRRGFSAWSAGMVVRRAVLSTSRTMRHNLRVLAGCVDWQLRGVTDTQGPCANPGEGNAERQGPGQRPRHLRRCARHGHVPQLGRRCRRAQQARSLPGHRACALQGALLHCA